MIKRFVQFVKENVNNPDSYLDSKMQEIKDMIGTIENGTPLIYDWENKNDHELYVNFTKDDLSIRYEFDIDDLKLTKIAGGATDFQTAVDSMDAGINMIESDINSILGLNEGLFDIFKKDEPEKISIWLKVLKDERVTHRTVFMDFTSYTGSDKKVNRYLIKCMSNDLSLNLQDVAVNSFHESKLGVVMEYLKGLGLKMVEFDGQDCLFKGELTLKELKKSSI